MSESLNQNNCSTCNHKQYPGGGHCYMFRAAPAEPCAHHTFQIAHLQAMTHPTPPNIAAELPKALRHAADIEHWAKCDNGLRGTELRAAAAELRRIHAYAMELESQVFVDCMTHEPSPQREAQEPIAYLYHDARTPADAHPWLHSTMLVLAADRRPGLRGETPLYAAPQPATADAQEPAATVFMMEALTPGGGVKYHATIHRPLPAGTKLYTAPIALAGGVQATSVVIDFAQIGSAGPFPVVNGRVSLPDATMKDLVRMLRPTFEAQAPAALEPVAWRWLHEGKPEGSACFAMPGPTIDIQARAGVTGHTVQYLYDRPQTPSDGFDACDMATMGAQQFLAEQASQPSTADARTTQPLVTDGQGVLRFQKNALVDALYEHGVKTGLGLNELHRMDFSDEDRQQFAQLIGYSLSGYGTLGYVSDEAYAAAERAAMTAQKGGARWQAR